MSAIVTPIDFSDTSGRLLEAAEAEARLRGARLHLLHVIEPSAELAGFEADPQMMRLQINPITGDSEKAEEMRLEKLAAEIRGRGISCDHAVKFGLPADEIIAAVEEQGADLIVMGSHGRGAIYHLFAGSVVTGVLKRTKRPVLVVPLRGQPGK